jgi:hypothetical protein
VGHVPVVVVEDVVGTHMPFCSIALVPQTLFVDVEVKGTHMPFCSTVPEGHIIGYVGTQTPFCDIEGLVIVI